MKILFAMRHTGYLRNFLNVIDELDARGHHLHFVFESKAALGEDQVFAELMTRRPRISCTYLSKGERAIQVPWRRFARELRVAFDYFRYLEKPFANAHALRERARAKCPAWALEFGDQWLRRFPWIMPLVRWAGSVAEWGLPVPPHVEKVFAELEPDLLLVTPLLPIGEVQVDWVKAAKRHGVPSILTVASWDNLTNKGRIRVAPDHVMVWNEAQRTEARRFHAISGQHVDVCGAWTYDHWFSWRPGHERDVFLNGLGFGADDRYLLYVGSSPFIAPEEVGFAKRFVGALRADPELRNLKVVIRPHPQNAVQWRQSDFDPFGGVLVYPPRGANPLGDDARQVYFDSLWFSEAVFGINTSAQIEAGIIGRPVMSVLDEEFAHTQRGTLHFQHLSDPDNGLLHLHDSIDDMVGDLRDLLSMPMIERGRRSDRFVNHFIRPYGRDVSGCEKAVALIENGAQIKLRVPRIRMALGGLLRKWGFAKTQSFEVTRKLAAAVSELRVTSGRE